MFKSHSGFFFMLGNKTSKHESNIFSFFLNARRGDGVGGFRDGDVRDDSSHLRVIGK